MRTRDLYHNDAQQLIGFQEPDHAKLCESQLDPSRFEKVRGSAPSLAGRDPVEVIREMRGE